MRLVGMRFGKVFATATGSSTLQDITGPWPVSANLAVQPRRFVSRVAIDPTDSNVAYVAFATYCGAVSTCGQVYKTTNLVTALTGWSTPSWTKASAGLPDIPVSAFVVDPRNPQTLFAGTDIGVYASSDGGASWAPFGSGLPRVSVFDLALHAPSGTLRAATHGRGIWEIAVGDATPVFSGLASPNIGLGSTPTLLYGIPEGGIPRGHRAAWRSLSGRRRSLSGPWIRPPVSSPLPSTPARSARAATRSATAMRVGGGFNPPRGAAPSPWARRSSHATSIDGARSPSIPTTRR